MKKLIQVLLIVVVVFVMVQAVIGGTMALSGQTRSNEVRSTYFTTIASAQNVQWLICSDGRGVSCVKPNVGWNS